MINDYCGSLDSFFDFTVKYGLLDVDNAQCFYVDPSLESGFYFLLFACALLLGTTVLISTVAKAVVIERMEKLARRIKAPAILAPGSSGSAFSIDPFEISDDQSNNNLENAIELKHVESPPTHPKRFFGFGWLLTNPPPDDTFIENDGQGDEADDDDIFTGVIAAPQTLRGSSSEEEVSTIDEISVMTPPYAYADRGLV